jgi:PmbA protein
VTVSDSRRCELNLAHNEPSLLRSNEARKLAATGIVGGRRASAEGNDLSRRRRGPAGRRTCGRRRLGAARRGQCGVGRPDGDAGQAARARPTRRSWPRRCARCWTGAPRNTPTMMIEEALAAHVHSRSHTVTSGGSAIACDFGWCELSVFGLAREAAGPAPSTTPAAPPTRWPTCRTPSASTA